MPIHAPAHDPAEFSARLKEVMLDAGENAGRGAGPALKRRYKVSVVTANAWLNGTHLPSPDRAMDMANDYGVAFDWLYFGKLPKRPRKVAETSADYGEAQHTDVLNPRERALLENYRASNETTKNVVDAAAAAGVEQLTPDHTRARRTRKRG